MKKRIGDFILIFAGLIAVYFAIMWALWSTLLALRFLEPAVVMGGVIILVLIGVYLRGDK